MRIAVVLMFAVAIAGCRDAGQEEGEPGTAPLLPAATRAQLDSGNAAFRARELDRAQRHYQAGARISPEFAAPWLGLAMVARVRGDTTAMRVAEETAERLSPGVNTSHPIGGALPPAHPQIAPGTTQPKASGPVPR